MKVVIQRVIQASVTIQQQLHASIGRGIMILVGIQADDHEEDIEWLSSKICNLRIFDDENGIMNRSILETLVFFTSTPYFPKLHIPILLQILHYNVLTNAMPKPYGCTKSLMEKLINVYGLVTGFLY